MRKVCSKWLYLRSNTWSEQLCDCLKKGSSKRDQCLLQWLTLQQPEGSQWWPWWVIESTLHSVNLTQIMASAWLVKMSVAISKTVFFRITLSQSNVKFSQDVIHIFLKLRPFYYILSWMHSNCAFVFFSKVTQRQSGEVMVMKELLNYDETAKVSFLKEVSYIFFIKLGWTSAFSRHSIYRTAQKLGAQCH